MDNQNNSNPFLKFNQYQPQLKAIGDKILYVNNFLDEIT